LRRRVMGVGEEASLRPFHAVVLYWDKT